MSLQRCRNAHPNVLMYISCARCTRVAKYLKMFSKGIIPIPIIPMLLLIYCFDHAQNLMPYFNYGTSTTAHLSVELCKFVVIHENC